MDNDFISDLASRVTMIEVSELTDLKTRADTMEGRLDDHAARMDEHHDRLTALES
jgi:hypothetical protein